MATLNVRTFTDRKEAEVHHLTLIDSFAAGVRAVDATQETVYQRKLAEAIQGNGSLIEAEADAIGADVAEVAAAVLKKREAWEEYIHLVEVKRIKAKSDIRSASTPAAMHQVVKEFRQQLTLLQ